MDCAFVSVYVCSVSIQKDYYLSVCVRRMSAYTDLYSCVDLNVSHQSM